LYHESRRLAAALSALAAYDFAGAATGDRRSHGDVRRTLSRGREFLAQIVECEGAAPGCAAAARAASASRADFERVADLRARIERVTAEALRANPLLDLRRLLVVKRVPPATRGGRVGPTGDSASTSACRGRARGTAAR